MKKKTNKKFGQVLKESGYKAYNMSIVDDHINLTKHTWVLTRKEDNKQMTGSVVKFVEWNDNGVGGKIHDNPAVGRSIALDPMNYGNYKWLTTEIIEIISETEVKTKNSTYTLHKV
jgi:hypothetical protein